MPATASADKVPCATLSRELDSVFALASSNIHRDHAAQIFDCVPPDEHPIASKLAVQLTTAH
jgi:hypothetical protein